MFIWRLLCVLEAITPALAVQMLKNSKYKPRNNEPDVILNEFRKFQWTQNYGVDILRIFSRLLRVEIVPTWHKTAGSSVAVIAMQMEFHDWRTHAALGLAASNLHAENVNLWKNIPSVQVQREHINIAYILNKLQPI